MKTITDCQEGDTITLLDNVSGTIRAGDKARIVRHKPYSIILTMLSGQSRYYTVHVHPHCRVEAK